MPLSIGSCVYVCVCACMRVCVPSLFNAHACMMINVRYCVSCVNECVCVCVCVFLLFNVHMPALMRTLRMSHKYF